MIARRSVRGVLVVAAALAGLALPAVAIGDHGGGGAGSSTTATTAGSPALKISPASLSFASENTGTTSAAQTVTATDTGNASLFFNNVAIGGSDPLDFTIVDDQCIGSTLAPGASCTISVTFSPQNTGTRSATVTYTDNAPDSPQVVTLIGNGTGTPAPLAIDDQFFSCSGGVCDVGANHNDFVNNFFTTTFEASGGSQPY